jgi:hypothetical protein
MWDGSDLMSAGCTLEPLCFTLAGQMVIEIPRLYPQDTRAVMNDLLTLSVTAGIWIGLNAHATCTRLHPQDWKAQLTKEQGNKRTREALSTVELAHVELPRSTKGQTDVWDAIGIGLVYLGRKRRGLL